MNDNILENIIEEARKKLPLKPIKGFSSVVITIDRTTNKNILKPYYVMFIVSYINGIFVEWKFAKIN